MAGKATPFYDAYYQDDEVEKWETLKKMLFAYLFTSEFINTSGIYKLTKKRMRETTGINSAALIDHYLGLKKLSADAYRAELHKLVDRWANDYPVDNQFGFRNAEYDEETATIFIRRRFAYMLGGRADWVEDSIDKDREFLRGQPERFWREFEERYAVRLTELAAESAIMREKYGKGHRRRRRDCSKAESAERTADRQEINAEDTKRLHEIDAAFAKMKADLLALAPRFPGVDMMDDYKKITAAFVYCTTNKKTKQPLGIGTRHRIAMEMSARPAILIAKAAALFMARTETHPGIDFAYFRGIVNGSAETWYNENFGDASAPLFAGKTPSRLEKKLKAQRGDHGTIRS